MGHAEVGERPIFTGDGGRDESKKGDVDGDLRFDRAGLAGLAGPYATASYDDDDDE
jgi:hypothetical protein